MTEKKPLGGDHGDLLWLFLGGFAQWGLSSLFARYAAQRVAGHVLIVTFVGQTLWWLNIQHTTRRNGIARWFAWSSGAALGAAAAVWL